MALSLSTLSSTGDRGTPQGTGDYYVSIAAWEPDAQARHVAGTQTVLECYEGTTVTGNWQADGSLSEPLNISGWSNNTATNNITIRAADGESHNGVVDTGFRVSYISASYIWYCYESYATFEGFQLKNNQAGTQTAGIMEGFFDLTFNDMILIRNSDADSTIGGSLYVYLTGLTIRNCLFLDRGATTLPVLRLESGTGATLENNTFVNGSDSGRWIYPLANMDATHSFKNNVIYFSTLKIGTNTIDTTGWDTNAYKAGIDEPIGANQTLNIVEADFTSYAGEDYSPAPAGNLDGSVNAGLDLSTEFTTDITRATRTLPWEMGAYDILGAAPTPAVLSDPTVVPAETTALIGCTTDTAGGTLYWYVSTSATEPSASDLKDGTGSVSFGNLVPSLGANTDTVTGLTASTQYWHYWIQETSS